MDTPLIFLAFANDTDAHLDLLKEESRMLFHALEELDRKEYIKIYREESANAKDLFDGFTRYKDRVGIFHYGGHSSGTHLRLEGGDGHAQGLAQLMGEQTNLKLVFLNGCANKDQVNRLMDAGVKAIIATSVPIEDRTATEFAEQFYDALAHRRTIGQAFSLARALVQTQKGDGFPIQHRGFAALAEAEAAAETEVPWGLYIKEGHEDEILNYKLPYYRPVSLPDSVIDGIKRDFTANRYLIRILEDIGKYNPDIYSKMVQQKGEATERVDSSSYPQLLISSFPWPIGSQIRILFVKEWREFGQLRLKQLLSTYVITSQVLYYILLSDLWEHVEEQKLDLSEGVDYRLPTDKTSYRDVDWLSRMAEVYGQLEALELTPFAPEYDLLAEAWRDKSSSFRKAHAFLEKLRSKIDDLPKADLDKVCLRVEQAVALVLQQAAFLSRYRMLTVRNIMIDQPRCQDLTYELDMGQLNNSDGNFLSLYQDDNKRRKRSHANSRAIILTTNEDQLSESMDLSPFLMDRNTFVSTLQGGAAQDSTAKLFLIGWQDGGRVHYVSIDQSLYSVLGEGLYQVHTDMTQADFDEGKNSTEVNTDADDDWLDADFGDAFDDDSLPTETEESPKAFVLLKQQYEAFLNDMHISQSPLSHA